MMSLQRTIIDQNGNTIDPCELKIELTKNYSVFSVMVCAGILLLNGIKPQKFWINIRKMPKMTNGDIMSKISNKKIIIILVFLAFALLTLFVTGSYAIAVNEEIKDDWVIQSFDNTVVLLNNGEIIQVFGDIMVENLPNEDKKHLETGISFLTKDEALLALEDYDG